MLDDGSLSNSNIGHTIPRGDRGLLLKSAEQTVSKDAKKKLKKQKAKIKRQEAINRLRLCKDSTIVTPRNRTFVSLN